MTKDLTEFLARQPWNISSIEEISVPGERRPAFAVEMFRAVPVEAANLASLVHSATAFRDWEIDRQAAVPVVAPDGSLMIVVYGKRPVTPDCYMVVFADEDCVSIALPMATGGRVVVIYPGSPEFDALKLQRIKIAYVRGLGGRDIEYYATSLSENEVAELAQIVGANPSGGINRHALMQRGIIRLREISVRSSQNNYQLTPVESLQASWALVYTVYTVSLAQNFTRWLAETTDPAAAIAQFPPVIAEVMGSIWSAPTILDGVFNIADDFATREDSPARMLMINQLLEQDPTAYADASSEFTTHPLRLCNMAAALSLLSPIASNKGKRLRPANNLITAPFIDIDVSGMSSELAWRYWTTLPLTTPLAIASLIKPADVPIAPEELITFKPTLNVDESIDAAQALMDEAVADRKWVIPAGARVSIDVGPFHAAEFTEVGGQVLVVWRDRTERFLITSFFTGAGQLTSRGWDIPGLNKEASTLLTLTAAAVARDFLVVEERHNVFGVTRQITRTGTSKKKTATIIYLPRIKYINTSTISCKALSAALDQAKRSEHFVKSHVRRVGNASLLQKVIAKNEGVVLEDGQTYVRGHYRGEGLNNERIYRSRSASQLLFGIADQQPAPLSSDPTDWFNFERMTATLLEKLGYTVLQKASRGRADHGIDVLATKKNGSNLETFVVQCKCYDPSTVVEPGTVRELIGTMKLVDDGDTPVRGIIVTTTTFSSGALTLAAQNNIELIDGRRFNAMCAAVNSAAHH